MWPRLADDLAVSAVTPSLYIEHAPLHIEHAPLHIEHAPLHIEHAPLHIVVAAPGK